MPSIDRFVALIEKTAPAEEPITKTELKAHIGGIADANVDHDTQLDSIILTARRRAETELQRAILTRDFTLWMDGFPGSSLQPPMWDGVREGAISEVLGGGRGYLELPQGQLTAVAHVKTYDNDDSATTWAASNYFVDTKNEPGRIVLRQGVSWPVVTRRGNGVEIEFTAGWASAAAVPDDLKQALLVDGASLWRNRGGDEFPDLPTALLSDYYFASHWVS